MDGILTGSSTEAAARAWLGDFATALDAAEPARLAALFAAECHWRDVLAFTWDLRTVSGAAAIAERLLPALGGARAARRRPRRRPHAAAPRDARGDRGDRGDLHLRDGDRPLHRRRPAGERGRRRRAPGR